MKRNIGKKLRNNKGITLVALVVTIIVLLILAGVTLSMIFNEKGIFNRTEIAKNKYNEEKAREVLEMVLAGDGQYEKRSNSFYNQNEFLDNLIKTEIEDADVIGDIAIVGDYAFELDRSVPKIGHYVGSLKDLDFPIVGFSPNGSTVYRKEHTTKVIVKETTEKVKSLKYIWTQNEEAPDETEFTEICPSDNKITGKDFNGVYYVWVLVETASGKKKVFGSKAFSFDNTGKLDGWSYRETLTSPNYPENYPNNCRWLKELNYGSSVSNIMVIFRDVHVEPGCNYDYIEIFDGPHLTSPLIARICDGAASFTSTGPQMDIRFTSDHSENFSGFTFDVYTKSIEVCTNCNND